MSLLNAISNAVAASPVRPWFLPCVSLSARAMVAACTHYRDPATVAKVSTGLGKAMVGLLENEPGQAGRGREPDAFLAGLIVTATLQVVSMVPVNQIHQLKKTVSPRVAENGFQPGYISGC